MKVRKLTRVRKKIDKLYDVYVTRAIIDTFVLTLRFIIQIYMLQTTNICTLCLASPDKINTYIKVEENTALGRNILIVRVASMDRANKTLIAISISE